MPKIAFFPLNTQGITALQDFQESNEILNFRAMRVQTEQLANGYQDRQFTPGVWCIAVMYIPAPEIKYPEVSNDGTEPPTNDTKRSKKSSSDK